MLVVALGSLLLLNLAVILNARHKTQQIFDQLDEVYSGHAQVESRLQMLKADIHLSGVYVRDYLLDNSHLTGPAYRARLRELRANTERLLREIQDQARWGDPGRVESLRQRTTDYWQTYDPLFDWTPAQKTLLSTAFLRRTVLPKRDAVMDIVREVEEFNNAVMLGQRAQASEQELELKDYMTRMAWISVSVGMLFASAAGFRFHRIEQRARADRARSVEAENEMRRLSQQLVRTQEEERRNLSRELHDQIGQMLTALRMEVGNAEKSRGDQSIFSRHVAASKDIIDTMVRTVRDLSMGLRPSMLDDFGLGPALEWQARDFSRRFDIPVNVMITGDLDVLPEAYRTCVYRVTQEALTNCARHSGASQISITVRRNGNHVALLVHDDGAGIQTPTGPGKGLGLLGIQERVRELNGRFQIHSTRQAGTTLEVDLPLEEMSAHSARG